MAKKAKSKTIAELEDTIAGPVHPPLTPAGKCSKCRAWKTNNKLAGFWVGRCKVKNVDTAESFSCDKFEVRK